MQQFRQIPLKQLDNSVKKKSWWTATRACAEFEISAEKFISKFSDHLTTIYAPFLDRRSVCSVSLAVLHRFSTKIPRLFLYRFSTRRVYRSIQDRFSTSWGNSDIDLSSNVDTRTVLSMVYMYLWLTTALRVIGVLCLRIVTLYTHSTVFASMFR